MPQARGIERETEDPTVCLEDAILAFKKEGAKKLPDLQKYVGDPEIFTDLDHEIMDAIAAIVEGTQKKGRVTFMAEREKFDTLEPLVGKPLSEWKRLYLDVVLKIAASTAGWDTEI